MKRKLVSLLLLLVLTLSLPLTGMVSQEPIEFAVIVTSLTGSLATNGDYMTKGINLALEEINASGGINGAELKATFLDDQVQASEAINAIKKAIHEMKVPVILGSDSSGLILASMEYAAEAGIPQVVSGTNVRVTQAGYKTIFRMRASDAIPAKILAEYVYNNDGRKNVSFFYTNEDYGKGFMQATDENLKALGAEVLSYETCNIGDTDFTAQILNIKNQNPDAVLALGKEIELSKFLRQARELGLTTPIYGGSTLGLDYVIDLAGKENLEGVKIVTHYMPQDPDPVVVEFVNKFEAKYDGLEPTTHAVCYYDATHLIAEVMRKYGTTPEEIAKGLHEIEYTGVQSKFKSDDKGEMVTKQVVGEFVNGAWTVIASIEN